MSDKVQLTEGSKQKQLNLLNALKSAIKGQDPIENLKLVIELAEGQAAQGALCGCPPLFMLARPLVVGRCVPQSEPVWHMVAATALG